jgi:hypothetical protein
VCVVYLARAAAARKVLLRPRRVRLHSR